MLLLDLKHSGKLCEDLIIRGSNDGSNAASGYRPGPATLLTARQVTPPNSHHRSCDFTAHMCTGIIHKNYKLFVNP